MQYRCFSLSGDIDSAGLVLKHCQRRDHQLYCSLYRSLTSFLTSCPVWSSMSIVLVYAFLQLFVSTCSSKLDGQKLRFIGLSWQVRNCLPQS